MSIFEFITFLFPFLKEMILGDMPIQEGMKTSKFRVFLLAATVISFIVNLVIVPKIIEVSAEYVRLEKKYNEVVAPRVVVPAKIITPPAVRIDPPAVVIPPVPAPEPTPLPLTDVAASSPVVVPPKVYPRHSPPHPLHPVHHHVKELPEVVTPVATPKIDEQQRYADWKDSFDKIREANEYRHH